MSEPTLLERLTEVHDAIFAKLPKGPHVIRTWAGRHATITPEGRGSIWDWCGGPGLCEACDEGRGVTVEDTLAWRELTGWMAALAFGKRGHARCSAATYEGLKANCLLKDDRIFGWQTLMGRPLNGFSVHVADDVQEGVLVRCSCSEKKEEGLRD